MEDANQQNIDQFAPISSPGDRAPELHTLSEKNLAQKDERFVSSNPSATLGLTMAPRYLKPVVSETSGAITTMNPLSSYAPQDQGYYFGGGFSGYENGSGHWDELPNYVGANSLHVIPPAIYNENSSLYYPGYGFDSQMAFGQFSPLASPLSPFLIDSQMFSPHQISVPPSYYPPPPSPGPQHVSSALPASQTDMLPPGSNSQENITDGAFFGPGTGYFLPFGNFGGDLSVSNSVGLYKFPGEFGSTESLPSCSSSFDSSRIMSPLTSGNAFPTPFGLLGSYQQTVVQAPFQGFGLPSNSSSKHHPSSGSYQSSVGSNPIRSWITTEKGGKREKDRELVNNSTDTLGSSNEWNRGPRASKPKSKSSSVDGSLAGVKNSESTSGFHVQHLNSPDFITDYERAKFFVIKSFSEDNIHKSIKYSVWASTPLGNRKLDTAYSESREMEGICPVFLFFHGQFCGVAEMTGPVNFEKDADYWQQDRWSGQFPVKWHIIKDVPNSRFRHILLEYNDNKPVTHSRDSQEVKLDQGIEMLKIFKNHESDTSLLDDFNFYDEREKSLVERKAKQRAAAAVGNEASTVAAESIDHLSEKLSDTLNIDTGRNSSQSSSEPK